MYTGGIPGASESSDLPSGSRGLGRGPKKTRIKTDAGGTAVEKRRASDEGGRGEERRGGG